MSTPEWMKKFQQIGQKGDEEVTETGESGFVKRNEQRRTSVGSSDVDSKMHSSFGSSFRTSDSGDKSSGNNVSRVSEGPASSDDEASSDGGSTNDGVINDDANTNPSSDGASGENEAESVEMPAATTGKREDFGDSWVPDEDKLKNLGSTGIEPEVAADVSSRQSLSHGESFVTEEEILVDEDGNEILVDENGDEIQVDENGEEIQADESDDEIQVDESDDEIQVVESGDESQVDESGDEIQVDENGDEIQVDENGDEIQVDENGDEIHEEEVLVDESVKNFEPHNVQESNENDKRAYTDRYGEGVQQNLSSGVIYDIEEQRRILGVGKPGKRSRMSWCIPILIFAMIVASVVLVIFFIVYNEDREISGLTPTKAPTPSNFEPSSSGGIDAAATTEFDEIQNTCSFDSLGLVQPNIVDQCNCGDENIDIIADDVRARWEDLVQTFIPSIYSQWNVPINSCIPENQALVWLSSGINNGGEVDNLIRLQRYSLALLYYHQGGTEWSSSTNWLSEKNACEWEGVECDDNFHVRVLDLDENRLTGRLSDAPTFLNAIEAYFASNNNLIGSIPASFFNDNSLRYIDFSGNALSGQFPRDISNVSKLNRIIFEANNLSGTIPGEIGKISGLEVLNVESNAFSGALPSSLFTLPLAELYIGGNELTGTIPADLPSVNSTLTSLSLGPNIFTGDLPTSLGELTGLTRLSAVGIPDLSGRLPASYGLSLTDLVELSISDTNVEGDIPDQYSMMTKLETIRLSNNNIRGRIPSSLGALTNLLIFSLHGNDLTGTIPAEMGLLASLQELQFHTNSFSGSIPAEFGNLLNIRILTLDDNLMSGRVPNGLCALRNADLDKFVVDCPTLIGESRVDGIICSIPDCCTECL